MAIATLTIDINAKLANIERDLGKVSHLAEQSGQRISAAFGAARTAFAALGAGLSASAFAAGLKNVIDGADQLNKASQKYGIAVEQLSALQYAGALSDVSLEAIGNGLKKLSVNMLDTAAGTGEAKAAFDALGIGVQEASGGLKSSDAVLAEIADRFASMEDGAGKTALAVRLFGRAGADLIPLLNQGAQGLTDMKSEAERLGVIIGSDLAQQSEALNDNLTRLSQSLRGEFVSAANAVAGILNTTVEALVGMRKEGEGSSMVLQGLKTAFETIAVVGANVAFVFQGIGREIGGIAAQLAALSRGDLKAFKAIGDALREDGITARKALEDFEKRIFGTGGGKETSDFGPPVWKTGAPTLAAGGAASSRTAGRAEDPFEAMKKAVMAQHELAESAANADAQIRKLRDSYTDLIDPAAQLRRELAEFDQIAPALDLSADELERIRNVFLEKIHVKEFVGPLQDVTEEIRQQKSLAEDLGLTFQSAFEDAVISGKKFSDVLKGLADDIARMILRKTVTEPLGNALSSMINSFLPSFGGGRAAGGSVTPGRYYVVGENGPEVLVPNSAGTVIPNGAGGAVTVQIIEAPGRGGEVSQRRDAGGGTFLQVLVEQVKGSLIDDVTRGGSFAGTMQGIYGLNRAAGAWR